MRTFCVLTAVVILAPLAVARVWTSVCRCDEATPLAPADANYPTVYRDVMVGTHLVIVVSSDTVEAWSGALRLSWDDANDATLSGRGFDPESWNYEGSCLEAAGSKALVMEYLGTEGLGLQYSNYARDATPGDWFVFDYRAEQIGLADLVFYEIPSEPDVPIEMLSFTHVPTRDFNGDHVVNFEDLASLAGFWGTPGVPDMKQSDAAFDLDADGRIDAGDLALFTEYWLERTDCDDPAAGPDDSAAP